MISFRQWFASSVLATIASLMLAAPAGAAVYTYSFTGTVNLLAVPLAGGSVALGDAVSGTFSFDTSVAENPLLVGDITQSVFVGATSGSLTIGGSGHFVSFANTLAVIANNCCSGFDGFQVSKGGTFPGTVVGSPLNGIPLAPIGPAGPQQFVLLSDTSQSVFSSDQLSAVPFPLSLASFNNARGTLRYGDGSVSGSYVLQYSIDSLNPVPLPGALALLGAGLLGFGALRRRLKSPLVNGCSPRQEI